jgi:hypothetical protein
MASNNRNLHRIWIICMLSAGLLSSCSVLAPPAFSGQTLFQDDFSNRSSGWKRSASGDLVMDYHDSSYGFQLQKPLVEAWSTPGLEFTDTLIEVDATKIDGIQGTQFGLICRYQDSDNFYFFLISDDGFGVIGRTLHGEKQLISHQTMLPDENILQGSSTNHLEADCVSEKLVFKVNGNIIAEAEDNQLSFGDVGLIAFSADQPGEIRFSSFIVRTP